MTLCCCGISVFFSLLAVEQMSSLNVAVVEINLQRFITQLCSQALPNKLFVSLRLIVLVVPVTNSTVVVYRDFHISTAITSQQLSKIMEMVWGESRLMACSMLV